MALKDEGSFWALTREAFKRHGAFIRKLPAEGFAGKGTPDGIFAYSMTSGVIELKYVKEWPKRPGTTVPVDLTPEQWNWLSDFVDKGGRGYVLLGVEDDWFLLRLHEIAAFESRADGGFRATQQALRASKLQGRLGELSRVPDLVAQVAVRS